MSEMEMKKLQNRIEYLSFACFLFCLLFTLGVVFLPVLEPISQIFGLIGLICGVLTFTRMKTISNTARKILNSFIVILGIIFFFCGLFLLLNVPGWIPAKGQGKLTACESNLKNIGTALEMYADDNEGSYPIQFSSLVPNYLKQIPICPAAESDTYSRSYRVKFSPQSYDLFCFGHYHEKMGVPPNYPRYDSEKGLIVK